MKSFRELETKLYQRVNPLVRFSVTRYVLAIGIFVALVVFGLVSAANLGVDLLPTVQIPVVVVTTSFPGASPAVVDQQISQIIEDTVSASGGITLLRSMSFQGLSLVIISFDPSTDTNADANQIAALVSSVARNLPVGALAPTIRTFDPNALPILQFGIFSGRDTLEAAGNWVQNDLTPLLERVNGVANVQVDGAPQREFQVLLNPNKLANLGLDPQDVTNAIGASAINQAIGSVVTGKVSITYATQGQPVDVSQIDRILVDPARGIHVGDVAVVRDLPLTSDIARVNGQPAVLVSIQQTIGSNAVSVVQDVRKLLSRTPLPTGYSIVYSNDTTGSIRASIDATYRELLLTGLVVALICLFFLGKPNTAFSVILAIPIALSAAPLLYRLAGFTFNLVSLLAMIVAIGVVVDDSIVVAENVERYRDMGHSLKDSVLKGASEVFSAVTAASLSLLSVLLPVSFLGGFIGRYLMQFSLGLAAAVLLSLLEAMLFLTVRLAYTPEMRSQGLAAIPSSILRLPQALRWGIRSAGRPLGIALGVGVGLLLVLLRLYWWLPALLGYPIALSLLNYLGGVLFALVQALTLVGHAATEAALEWVRGRYVASLEEVLRRAPWVLVGAGALFLITLLVLGPRIQFNFVPQSDGGVVQVNVRTPPGTTLEATNDMTGRVESNLFQQEAITTVQTLVGSNGTSGFVGSTNTASITAQLAPIQDRRSVFELIPQYREKLKPLLQEHPTLEAYISAGGGFRGQGNRVSFTLATSNFGLLESTNQKALAYFQGNPYVADASSDLSETTLENDFLPNPDGINGTGITPGSVANALQTYISGVQASNVELGGYSYPIMVQANPTYVSGVQSILSLPVYAPALHSSLAIGQLGTFALKQAPLRIARTNRRYSTDFDIDLKPDAPAPLAFQKLVTAEMTREGILSDEVTFGPQDRFGPEALAGQLETAGPLVFLLAFFLAYLVMGAQFNSWRYPMYLLLPVPLALVGALMLVWATGSGLDIFGVLGMLMLIGLSAKNAILYLDFVVERIDRMRFKDALVESARLRFRPIVMTTLTVLVISFPLIFGHGQGSEFGQRLGIVMLGGIVSSAILTFFVVPAAFYLFERKRHPDNST